MINADTLKSLGLTVATGDNIYAYIANIINSVLVIAGLLAFIYLIYAGLQYITSAGDESKAGAAKKNITNVVIGLVVIMLAWGIINFVMRAVQGEIKSGGNGGGNDNPIVVDPQLPDATPKDQTKADADQPVTQDSNTEKTTADRSGNYDSEAAQR